MQRFPVKVINDGCGFCAGSRLTGIVSADGSLLVIEIESSEPGARVEANNEYLGKTPMTLKIFGDKDGTFHNFGTYHYQITAYPTKAGQQPQTKHFRTGGWFTSGDRIPKKLFFDFGPVPEN
jgi:hypothetical protein